MPSEIALSRFHDLDAHVLQAPDGARATVLLHGGHVVSWLPAGQDEQLYLSERSAFAEGQAVRGGVPVVFPQFNARGPLQRHGFARNLPWQLVSAGQAADGAHAVLQLQDDTATRAAWPHGFRLELRVSVSGQQLSIDLACTNTGESAFTFTAALHTYLRVAALDATRLHGLAGLRYWDAVSDATLIQGEEWLLPGADLDRVYYGIDRELLLQESRDALNRRLFIRQQGFDDAVVWNPGAAKCAALRDMPPDGYRHMVCVEAACIAKPVTLAPQGSWSGRQQLRLGQ